MPNIRTVSVVHPTQVARPWHATVRSLVQLALALCSLIPLIVADVYTDVDQAPAVIGQVVGVMVAVTRIMALPAVEHFLRDFMPWLAADPDPAHVTVIAEASPVVVEDAAHRDERGAGEVTQIFVVAAGVLLAIVAWQALEYLTAL